MFLLPFENLEARCEGQEGDIPRLLDCPGKATLVGGANAGQTTRHDLAAFRYKALQQADVAVRNCIDLLGTELANLLATEEFTAATGATTGTAAAALARAR